MDFWQAAFHKVETSTRLQMCTHNKELGFLTQELSFSMDQYYIWELYST